MNNPSTILPRTTEAPKVNPSISFRTQNDLDIFHKLLKIQGMSADEFATTAMYHYITNMLDRPDKLRNPNAEKLRGVVFGDTAEDSDVLLEPGEERVEVKENGHSTTWMYVGAFKGKSVQILKENDAPASFEWRFETIKGKEVCTFWLDRD